MGRKTSSFILLLLVALGIMFVWRGGRDNRDIQKEFAQSAVRNKTFRQVISPSYPRQFLNESGKVEYHIVEKEGVKAIDEVKVEIEMKVDASNTADLTGLVIAVDQLDKDRADNVSIVRDSIQWMIQYKVQDKIKSFSLGSQGSSEKDKFTLIFAPDGKSLKISFEGKNKTIFLPDSLYIATNQLITLAQVAPASSLEIYSLKYQYYAPN